MTPRAASCRRSGRRWRTFARLSRCQETDAGRHHAWPAAGAQAGGGALLHALPIAEQLMRSGAGARSEHVVPAPRPEHRVAGDALIPCLRVFVGRPTEPWQGQGGSRLAHSSQ
eukprot:151325-Chlamydomonas_euryale.AAC.3